MTRTGLQSKIVKGNLMNQIQNIEEIACEPMLLLIGKLIIFALCVNFTVVTNEDAQEPAA